MPAAACTFYRAWLLSAKTCALPRVQILSKRTNSSKPISMPLSCVLWCQKRRTNLSAKTKLQALERLNSPRRLTALNPPSRGFRSPACNRKPTGHFTTPNCVTRLERKGKYDALRCVRYKRDRWGWRCTRLSCYRCREPGLPQQKLNNKTAQAALLKKSFA